MGRKERRKKNAKRQNVHRDGGSRSTASGHKGPPDVSQVKALETRVKTLEKSKQIALDEKYVKAPTLLEAALNDVKTKLSGDVKMCAALEVIDKAIHPGGLSLYCLPPHVHARVVLAFKGANISCDLPQSGDFTAMKQIIRVALGAGKGADLGFTKPLKVMLTFDDGTRVSAAGGGLFNVQAIRPSTSGEFSALSVLFDEYLCCGAGIAWQTKAGATGISTIPMGAVAYDPQINGAYSAVGSAVVAMDHYGPYVVDNVFTADTGRTNMHRFFVKIPIGSQYEYGAITTVATGNWTDTTVTAADYGYFKHVLESPGGAIIIASHSLMYFETLFRCRS